MKPVMFCRKSDRRVGLVAELDELRALLRRLGEQDAVVGEDADRIAVQVRVAGDQRRAVGRLELVEARAVDDARDAPRARRTACARRSTRCRAARRDRSAAPPPATRFERAELAPVELRDDLAADADGVALVLRPGSPRRPRRGCACRRRRASPRRRPRGSPSSPAAGRRGTPWRRPSPSRRSPTCPARRRRRRSSEPKTRQMVGMRSAERRVISRKPLPPGTKISRLVRQVGAARLGQVDDRQPVLRADLHRAGALHRRCTG